MTGMRTNFAADISRRLGGMAALLSCAAVLMTSSAFAAGTPDQQRAALTLTGSGAEPNTLITLSTGPQQALSAKVDQQGNFIFKNLGYIASEQLLFSLQLPPVTGKVIVPAARLNFSYRPNGSRVLITGNIGKASTISLNMSGSNANPLHVAGVRGDISFSARSETSVSSGLSQISASIIRVGEVCCPNLSIPTPPINIVVTSAPLAAPAPVTALPNSLLASPIATTGNNNTETVLPDADGPTVPGVKSVPVPATKPAVASPTTTSPTTTAPVKRPLYLAPLKPKAENKELDPSITQGSIALSSASYALPEQSFAISFSKSDYDSTWQGGFNDLTITVRNAVMENAVMVRKYIDASDLLAALRSLSSQEVDTSVNYTTSESVCKFGTLSRSLALTQSSADTNKLAFEKIMNDTNSRRKSSLYADQEAGVVAHMKTFQDTYCKSTDNNNFLKTYCNVTATNPDLTLNRDVDFTRVFDTPLTINVDLANASGAVDSTSLISLFRNMTYTPPYDNVGTQDKNTPTDMSIDLARALSASRSVSNNSFASLVGQKVKGSGAVATYLVEALKKLGLTTTEAKGLLGDNPSYFAQMEVLTKKLYQDPAFFANLYDSPQNVDRQKVAMEAITLQQDRDFLESLRRREMLLSTLLSLKMRTTGEAENDNGVNASVNTSK